MKYFFLTGAHKCGTSWLAQMMRRHPAVAMPRQELWMFGHPRGLVGGQFDKLLSDWLSLGTVAAQFAPDDHDSIKANCRRMLVVSVLQRFAKPGCEAIGEKTPLFTLRGLAELKAAFSGAYVVSILRDGRDAAVSHHFHNLRLRDFSLYENQAAGEAAYAYHVARTSEAYVPLLNPPTLRRVAGNWAECLRAEAAVKEIIGRRGLCLRYEQVLADPTGWLSRVFDHLGLEGDEKLVQKIVRATSFEKMSKGRKPGENNPQSFLRKGSSGDWRQYFDAESAAAFNECAGAELIAGGYVSDPDWYERDSREEAGA